MVALVVDVKSLQRWIHPIPDTSAQSQSKCTLAFLSNLLFFLVFYFLTLFGISFTSLITNQNYFPFSLPPYPLTVANPQSIYPLIPYLSPTMIQDEEGEEAWVGGGHKRKEQGGSSLFPADITGFSWSFLSLLNILFLTYTTQFISKPHVAELDYYRSTMQHHTAANHVGQWS